MSRICRQVLPLLAVLAVAGCSDGEKATAGAAGADKSHVWSAQAQAIDKARDVGGQLKAAAARQSDATR